MDVRDGGAPAEALTAPEWFRIMADTAPVMIWMSGVDKLSTYFNKPWLDFTGRTLDRELGVGWSEVVHPDDYARCVTTYVEAFDARRAFEMECRSRRHDGRYRWILNRGNPMHATDGTFLGYIGSGIDVTARKEAEAQRDLLHMAELGRLSDEHEDLQQTFFAIGLAATATLANPPTDRWCEVAETLTRVSDLAAAGAQRLHEAVLALNHSEMAGRGLVRLLCKLAADFRLRTGIEADIVLTGLVGSVPIEVAQTLYAAACESLRNVERHSNAGAVILGLNISPETVTLSIQDDGTVASVLSPDRGLNTGTSFGLRRVGQRVRDLHGSFVAGRNPDSGFQVRARLPLRLSAQLDTSHL